MKLDVAILGGGMAGGLVARHLSRRLPGARIALAERHAAGGFKVGESTVEIGSHYLIDRVGLSRYLYEHHLPKNGLRYFFDDEQRQTELTRMSEIGTINLPFHPAFQVDRSRLDADLRVMNAESGVHGRVGAKVTGVELGSGGADHTIQLVGEDGRSERWQARWVVDASGRTGLLSRQLGLRERDGTHALHAVWGRFENVADIDDWGDRDFRARVRHTARGISTIHFCYPGYWIWFIPLRGGLTSVGFVGQPPADADIRAMRTLDGFRAFLGRHRAIDTLLREAKPVDVAAYKNYTYGTKRFVSPDRWALCGEAASFVDPLYSPGADFIALENDYTVDLVARDLEGEAEASRTERAELYDAFLQFRHEAAMRLYRGLYGGLGSFEWMRLKWDFDIGCYYNLWVDPYYRGQTLELPWLRRQVRQRRHVLQALGNYADLFRQVEGHLRGSDLYHRRNEGVFSYGLENIDFVEAVGTERNQREVLGKTAEIFNGVRAQALRLLDRPEEADGPPLPLTTLMLPRPIVSP